MTAPGAYVLWKVEGGRHYLGRHAFHVEQGFGFGVHAGLPDQDHPKNYPYDPCISSDIQESFDVASAAKTGHAHHVGVRVNPGPRFRLPPLGH